MRLKTFHLFRVMAAVVAALALTVSSGAQEGFPLNGTWYGEYGPSAKDRTQVTLIMSWDGKTVKGIMNPGPDAIPLKVATLDSTKWAVHIEADAKDKSCNPIHFVADGKLENIGSRNRTITGTWSYGSNKGDFKLRMD